MNTQAKNHQHNDNEECYYCKYGEEVVNELQRKGIEEYGWYAELVPSGDEQTPTGFNAHTHGLAEIFNHPDLQIIIPMPGNTLMTILHTAIDTYVKNGIKFEVGKEYEEIIESSEKGYCDKVTFVEAIECERKVLRMVFPDKHGNLTEERIKDVFKLQYDV